MNKDKAIVDTLKRSESGTLPEDFAEKLMEKVYMAERKRNKRSVILSYIYSSLASSGLIGLTLYLLKKDLSFQFINNFKAFFVSINSDPIFGFSIYIGAIVLLLMFMDILVRKKFHKKRLKES